MPLNEFGEGPETEPSEVKGFVFQVWSDCNITWGEYSTWREAEFNAARLNQLVSLFHSHKAVYVQLRPTDGFRLSPRKILNIHKGMLTIEIWEREMHLPFDSSMIEYYTLEPKSGSPQSW